MRRMHLLPLAVLLVVGISACGASSTSSGSKGTALVGLFKLTPGVCTTGTPTGSYFRMIQPNGTIAHGKFFQNPDSKCKDQSFTVEAPGTDGGLITASYQPSDGRPFDAHGNALADRITVPGSFTAIKFGIATNAMDPQTHRQVAAPQIYNDNGRLSGQISAWSAAWNNLYFNQGSPKPDGSSPGLTTPLSGTYDPKTRAFVVTWASQIVGGPFNGFTGYWHLQGTFVTR